MGGFAKVKVRFPAIGPLNTRSVQHAGANVLTALSGWTCDHLEIKGNVCIDKARNEDHVIPPAGKGQEGLRRSYRLPNV